MIEYPHIQRRHKLIAAEATVKVIDVAVAPGLSVGYIMGVGDQVPAALSSSASSVTLIDPDELAWGDLSKYDAIVTGVRAYERRDDLRANNHRCWSTSRTAARSSCSTTRSSSTRRSTVRTRRR